MGTNYVLRYNACEHCSRYDEAHIGKQSFGWSFLFRAYPHELLNPAQPEWGYQPASPFGFPVLSRADWLRVLAEVRGDVFNEYGDEIETPVAWLSTIEPPDAALQRREDGMTTYPSYFDPTGWRDAEGFRFEPREFS